MSRKSSRRESMWGWSLLLMGWVAVTAAAAGAAPEQVASTPAGVWSNSLRLIEAGQFDDAASHLTDLEQLGPQGRQVAGWLRGLREMERSREELTRADREKYIAWAKEQHDKGNLRNAIACAASAYENAFDKDAFRAEPWLKELYNDVLSRAAQMRDEQKWLDAHSLYYQLAEIFEDDKQLDKLRRECLTHARLEVTYKPEGKWQDYLAGIEWRMVADALSKINTYYVHEADFRELTIAGLEQLVLLAESPTLRETFPTLQDEWDRKDFVNRIQYRIAQVERARSFSHGDAKDYFRRVLDINQETVQLPEAMLVTEFMSAAMDTLDEFSTVVWPVEFKEFDKQTRGDFIGVGISIARQGGRIRVVTPLEDSPAYYAGVQADDIIFKVNGEPLEDISLTQAVEMITGPIDTSVTLTIIRMVGGTEKEIDFTLKRAKVVIQSVKGFKRADDDPQAWDFMIDPEAGIGYIRVNQFANNTVAHLYDTIDRLQRQGGLRGAILDLRFNPGGLLTSAVQMAELFLAKGDRIVSTKGERMREWPIDADQSGPFRDLPLIVLINQQSASASEIVSGALKDHHRATIIGERTFGKFSVQNLMQLGGTDAHLKLTTAAYYLPSGKSLHRTDGATEWGVDPDIDVPVVPKELAKIYGIPREAEILSRPDRQTGGDQAAADKPEAGDLAAEAPDADAADGEVAADTDDEAADGEDEDDEYKEEPLPPDPNDRPDLDPQLETALFVMRVQLLGDSSPQIALQDGEPTEVSVK